MKHRLLALITLLFSSATLMAQNVGIGTAAPTDGRLEIEAPIAPGATASGADVNTTTTNGAQTVEAISRLGRVGNSTLIGTQGTLTINQTGSASPFSGAFGVYGSINHPGGGTIDIVGADARVASVSGVFGNAFSADVTERQGLAAVYGLMGMHNGGGGDITGGGRVYAGLFQSNGRILGLRGENSAFMEFLPDFQTQDYRTAVIGFYNSAANGGNNGGSTGSADTYFSIEANIPGLGDSDTEDDDIVMQFLTDEGNVGIGLTNPSTKLDINGELQVGSSGQGAATAGAGALRWNAGNLQYSDGGAWLTLSNTGNDFWTRNGADLYNTNTGDDVGIGVTVPAERLDVNGNLRVRTGVINTSGDHLGLMEGVRADDTSYEWVGFYSGTTRQGIILYDGQWTGANNRTDEFSITAENGNKLTLNTGGGDVCIMPDGAGQVGIGVINPTQALDINGRIRIRGGNPATGRILQSDATGVGTWVDASALSPWTRNGTNIYPQTLTDNVGIGDNTPGSKLVVTDATLSGIRIGNTTTFNNVESGRLFFDETGSNYTGTTVCGFAFHHDGAANTLSITSGCTGQANRMTFERDGDIGINTNNPTANLSVNGDANKTGGGNWTVFSDRRLKHNIYPYDRGLDLVLSVNPVRYQYNGKAGITDTARVFVGVIAQELQAVAPSMVETVNLNENGDNENDADWDPSQQSTKDQTYLEVNTSELDFAVVNAIKELNAKNEALEAENAELKTQLQAHEERLHRLEELFNNK